MTKKARPKSPAKIVLPKPPEPPAAPAGPEPVLLGEPSPTKIGGSGSRHTSITFRVDSITLEALQVCVDELGRGLPAELRISLSRRQSAAIRHALIEKAAAIRQKRGSL